MKKLLSLILAMAMILTLAPFAFAEEESEAAVENFTIKYNLGEILYNDETARMNNSNSRGFKDVFNYKTSNGFFNYVNASTETGRFSSSPVQYPTESTTNELVERALVFRKISDSTDGGFIAFEVNVPVSGTYTMKAIARYHTPRIVHVYHVTEDTTDYTNSKYEIGTYNNKEHYKDNPIVNTLCDVFDSNNSAVKINLTKGKHIFAFKGDYSEGYGSSYYASLGDFYLISGDGSGAALMPYLDGETTLEAGDTATLKGYNSSDASETAVSYSVSGDAVTVSDDGTITAAKAGNATVTMTATDASITTAKTYAVDITVTDAEVSGNASFVATSAVEGAVAVQANGYDDSILVNKLSIGTNVTVTANTDIEGYIFRGWKRGSSDNGVWLTTDASVSFPLMTNTYLTAVYDVAAEKEGNVNVEFYNYNGQYLGVAKNVADKTFGNITKPQATMTGHEFAFWAIEKDKEIDVSTVFEKLTRVVAQYTVADKYNVIVPANVESSKPSGSYAYDTEITFEATDAGTWTLNDEIVAYGDSYTYYVWSDAEIGFTAGGNSQAPIIALDPNSTDGASMISYDANGTEIIEVGIVWSTLNDAPEISGFTGKATSKANGNVSGQFTAIDEGTARGYLIYNDGTANRVVYSK